MTLPHSREAEASLLSCFLGSPAALSVLPEMRSDDFHLPFHRRVFEAIADLNEARRPVDLVAVSVHIGADEKMADAQALSEVAGAAPVWVNYRHYADVVMRDGTARRLIAACLDFASRAHAQDPAEVLSEARQTLADLEGRTQGGPVRLGERLQGVLDDVGARVASEDASATVGSGIASYDALVGPFRPGQLVVVAARPGIGKTAFAGCVALRAAKRGVPALVFSLEMSFSELAERFLGANARMPVDQIGRGLGARDLASLFVASRNLYDLPLWVDDRILTAGQIAAAARSWRARNDGKRALVVIDYLGLIKPTGRAETRALEVGRMAWAAKMLAKDLQCPVMLVSQLNRGSEKEGRKPNLSDLRDSGEIEQHADVVIFPHREGDLTQSGPADLLVSKNRGGKTGAVAVHWDGPLMVFDAVERREEEIYADRRYADAR